MKYKTKNCLYCGKPVPKDKRDFCSRRCCEKWVREVRRSQIYSQNKSTGSNSAFQSEPSSSGLAQTKDIKK